MAIPTKIPILPQPAITSYDYTDIAEGTGIQEFYGWQYRDTDGNRAYSLGDSSELGEWIELSGSVTTDQQSYEKLIDVDFDLKEFQKPKTVKGTGQITFTQFVYSPSANTRADSYVHAKIRKWDGTTETEIADVSGARLIGADTGGGPRVDCEKEVRNLFVDVPRTHFNKGDTLRLTMEVYGADKNAADGNQEVGITADPENRDGLFVVPSTDSPRTTTILKFKCPFDINL